MPCHCSQSPSASRPPLGSSPAHGSSRAPCSQSAPRTRDVVEDLSGSGLKAHENGQGTALMMVCSTYMSPQEGCLSTAPRIFALRPPQIHQYLSKHITTTATYVIRNPLDTSTFRCRYGLDLASFAIGQAFVHVARCTSLVRLGSCNLTHAFCTLGTLVSCTVRENSRPLHGLVMLLQVLVEDRNKD